MKKVYCMQDSWDLKNPGLIYPTEIEGTFSMPFYVEIGIDGKSDKEYELETVIEYKKSKFKTDKLILKQVYGRVFKIEYKDCTVLFKARRAKVRIGHRKFIDAKYVGKLKGPKDPLLMLVVADKNSSDDYEKLYDKYKILLMGYSERVDDDNK